MSTSLRLVAMWSKKRRRKKKKKGQFVTQKERANLRSNTQKQTKSSGACMAMGPLSPSVAVVIL